MSYFLFYSLQRHHLKTEQWFERQMELDIDFDSLLPNFAIWGMLLNLSVPQKLHLYNENNTS